jgi:hypothetical protein
MLKFLISNYRWMLPISYFISAITLRAFDVEWIPLIVGMLLMHLTTFIKGYYSNKYLTIIEVLIAMITCGYISKLPNYVDYLWLICIASLVSIQLLGFIHGCCWLIDDTHDNTHDE